MRRLGLLVDFMAPCSTLDSFRWSLRILTTPSHGKASRLVVVFIHRLPHPCQSSWADFYCWVWDEPVSVIYQEVDKDFAQASSFLSHWPHKIPLPSRELCPEGSNALHTFPGGKSVPCFQSWLGNGANSHSKLNRVFSTLATTVPICASLPRDRR